MSQGTLQTELSFDTLVNTVEDLFAVPERRRRLVRAAETFLNSKHLRDNSGALRRPVSELVGEDRRIVNLATLLAIHDRYCLQGLELGLEFRRGVLDMVTGTDLLTLKEAEQVLAEVLRDLEDQGVVWEQVSEATDNKPHWDRDRGELRIDGVLCKKFQNSARNQRKILDAFEERRWRARIDDPIPLKLRLDKKRRLAQTIQNLNDGLEHLRFHGDGTGEGVIWDYLKPPPAALP